MTFYHSALAGGHLEDAEPCEQWTDGVNEAFVHDAFEPLPDIYRRCDVLWAEPPWRAGFDVFEERAGVSGPDRTWKELMQAFGVNLLGLGVPTGIVTGAAGARLLPEPDRVEQVRLPTAPALLLCYDLPVTWSSKPIPWIDFVIAQLARRYECVGDPVCGYGRTGYIFVQAGRRFVLSDFNANCIGYIAEHASGWRP